MCSICLGRYTDPKLLPCGHTFCRQCLTDHISLTVTDRAAATFKCPNDRTEIQRPEPGLHPRQWAAKFPTDTFLKSLLQAVQIYEGSSSGDKRQKQGLSVDQNVQYEEHATVPNGPMCSEHPDRVNEFFCLRCNVLMCPHCAVRNHRHSSCECLSIEEALVRMQPRIQALRRRFDGQIRKIVQINSGEITPDGTLERSKTRAQHALDDLESKAAMFYQIVLQYIEDLRQQIREAGRGQMTENQQLNIVLNSVEATQRTFESLCNNNMGAEILNDLPKMEAQADEFDTATVAASQNSSTLKVEFLPHTAFSNFLRNPPPVGTIQISPTSDPRSLNLTAQSQMANNQQHQRPNQSIGRQRSTQTIQRQISDQAVRPTQTPRPPRQPTQRQQRNMTKINVKVPSEHVISWQLTGIAFVGISVVVADNINTC